MRKVKSSSICFCFIFLITVQFAHSQSSQIYINEFMASNSTTASDEAGDYDDWIELYNAADTDISLLGYYFTDDLTIPTKWAFPDIVMQAKGYLIIWADNELNEPGNHASFKLSQDGEQIGLFNGSVFIDQVTFGAQRTDVSFGREQDGLQTWVFFQSPLNRPTPGAPNRYSYQQFLSPPVFSPGEGFYYGYISIQLSSKEPGASIFYTLDGSHPTAAAEKYVNAIPISESTTIRAIALKIGEASDTLVSETVTKCYLLNIENAIPLINIACDPKEHDRIYYSANPDDERPSIPAQYKYFNQDHVLRGDLPINLSIRGGYSVISPKKSYQISFSQHNLLFNLFDQHYNSPLPQNAQESFHSHNLAGMAADYSLVRNYLAFQLLQKAGAYSPLVSFARLFINGKDRGIYVPMERIDKWFVRSRNFAPGEYDIIKTGNSHDCPLTMENENGAFFELKEGDFIAFNEFLTWLNSDDHSFQELAEKIDVTSFLYYDLICRFSNNKDSYDINYYLIKNRDRATSKWLILAWDFDESFGWDSHPNGYWYPYNKVFYQLRQTEEYNFLFLNTLADLINTKWSPAEVSKLINYMEDVFHADNPADELIWNDEWYDYADGAIPDFQTDPNYNPLSRYKQFDYIKQWIGERIDYLHNQTWEPDTALLTISPPLRGKGAIQVNSIVVTHFPWSGVYFQQVPIPISAVPDAGYNFLGWSDSTLPQQPEITLVLKSDYQFTAIFQPDSLYYEIVINEINYNSTNQFDPGDWVELFNPNQEVVDLAGWLLKDNALDRDFKFPAGTRIEPNDFLIVCQKKRDFHALFPMVKNYAGDLDFGLSSQGDEVRLYNPLQILIDSVKYHSSHPWPIEANGTGATLELLNSNLDNTIARNWQASAGFGSPGKPTLALPVITHFAVTDSSGSANIAKHRDVLIEMAGNDIDGEIVKWHISENNAIPMLEDFVFTNQPARYHIIGDEGDVNLFGWALDNDNQISRLTDTSRAAILLVLSDNRFSLSGTVNYLQNKQAIPDLEVRLTESKIVTKDTTNMNGSFQFENLYPGTVRLETKKTGDVRDAISCTDALLILYDLAGLLKLSHHAKITADAMEDGKITVADVQAILRYLVYDWENSNSAGQWRSMPQDTTFRLNANARTDFQCYALGDVNLNWGLNYAQGKDSLTSQDSIDIIVQSYDVTVHDQKYVKVPVVIRPKSESVHTLRFSLEYDPQVLIFSSVRKFKPLDNFIVEINAKETGKIHLAMAGVEGIRSDEILLECSFQSSWAANVTSTEIKLTNVEANDKKVKNVINGKIVLSSNDAETAPTKFELFQNYPNPFNQGTQILFQIPVACHVKLTVFNLKGERIRTMMNEIKAAGKYRATWDGKADNGATTTTGIYILKLQTDGFQKDRKLIQIK